jgi:ATP-dependent RNA helicase RhlE
MDFSQFGLHPDLLRGVQDLGFTRPTPIQKDAIPPAMDGRDMLGCAMTGSGKTAAFLLPILHRLLGKPRGTTRVLVLSPTRELAAQIEEHCAALARHTAVKSAAVFGGVAMGPQERAFRAGSDILVATPGRLLDHLQYGYARLDGVEVLVLDEADRMLDMGFLPDIRRVLARLPKRRQNLLFSATMPPPIVALTRELLVGPVTLNVERKAVPASGVEQAVYPVREDLKSWLLLELLRSHTIDSALVFTRTKHRANRLADFLVRHGVACDRIHGNRTQAQRTQALARFKDGATQVLVATDIAARGIDVTELSHVINFDVPAVPEDYIHRVGRTARAEATGDAVTFVADHEIKDLHAIERAIGRRLPRLTLPGFDYERRPAEKLEIPIAERIATIRTQRAAERTRAREKADRKLHGGSARAGSPAHAADSPGGRAGTAAKAFAPRPAAAHQPRPRNDHSGHAAPAETAAHRSMGSLGRRRLPPRGVRRRSLI